MDLTLADATALVARGLERAATLRIGVAIAIVDQFGHIVRLERSDGAAPASPQIAQAKAVTAAQLRRPTSELAKLDAEALRSLRDSVEFKMVALPGGVPLVRRGAVVGAVGVSGGSEQQEIEIAELLAKT